MPFCHNSRVWRTDGRTDGILIARPRLHSMQRVKMENSTPCKIDPPPKNIILKLCTRDYVGEVTRLANFGFNRCSGASPQIAKYYHLVTFLTHSPYLFTRSCAQVEQVDWFWCFVAQTTSFCATMVLLGVSTMVDHTWGNMPPKPLKWAWIGNFKPKRQNIKIAISPKI